MHQRLLEQGQQQVANLLLRNSAISNNRYDRSQSGAPRENRQPGQQQFLCLAQEGIAPIDQGVQRLMPGHGRSAASGQKPERSSSPPASCSTDNTLSRGTASSIASGMPSSRWQMDPTVAALASVKSNPTPRALARSANSRTDAYSRALAAVNTAFSGGVGNEGTRMTVRNRYSTVPPPCSIRGPNSLNTRGASSGCRRLIAHPDISLVLRNVLVPG